MNLQRILLTALLLVAFTAGAVGQESPTAELIDEFGLLVCDSILGRVDNLAFGLQNEPGSIAVILIYRPTVQPTQAEKRRKLISSALQNRGIESERYRFFLNERSPDGQIRTKFWKVPPGATAPLDESRPWNEPPPDVSHRFMFGYEDETGICPTFVPRAFANLLLDSPGSIGRVVIIVGNDPLVERFGFAKQWIDQLVGQYGVSRKRLRLVFRKSKDETGAEFWFIPAKKL